MTFTVASRLVMARGGRAVTDMPDLMDVDVRRAYLLRLRAVRPGYGRCRWWRSSRRRVIRRCRRWGWGH
jgi:hypothetical protein